MFAQSLITEVFITFAKNAQPIPELFESTHVFAQSESLIVLFKSPYKRSAPSVITTVSGARVGASAGGSGRATVVVVVVVVVVPETARLGN